MSAPQTSLDRQMNPNARLVQSDDFGHTYATRPCQEQADYDNRRRLAGWDLLFGKLSAGTLSGPGFPALDFKRDWKP